MPSATNRRPKKLSAKALAAYLKNPDHCPYCGKTDIVGEGLDVENGKAVQTVYCSWCLRDWEDVYTLTTVREIGVE